jgi:hypothetical protein
MSDDPALIEEIRLLLALEPGAAGLERLEEALTAGYAHALALEAHQLRLERRLRELAESDDADAVLRLARSSAAAGRDVVRLRALLSSLSDRARAVRSAAA